MNLILLENLGKVGDKHLLSEKASEHVRKILKLEVGSLLKVGSTSGFSGIAEIIACDGSQPVLVEIREIKVEQESSGICLILALPRPQALKKILEMASPLNISKIYLINSSKVEKSYFSSNILLDENLKHYLELGIEQSLDVFLPKVRIYKSFKLFLQEFEKINLNKDLLKLIAHPYSQKAFADYHNNLLGLGEKQSILAIGPEGGWSDYELNHFKEIGFYDFSLGKRILRVEQAVSSICGVFNYFKKI